MVANYNKDKYLAATLESIIAQDYPDWECIVVDDHSTDTSLDILRSFGERDRRFKVLERPLDMPKGANYCRNYAFSHSQGEFIQWFDSDDLMYPWFLREKVAYLAANPSMSYVVCRGEIEFDSEFEGNTKFGQRIQSDSPIADYLRFRLLFFIAGPLIRRRVLEQIGLFNFRLRRHQEWELFFRMLLLQADWGIVDRVSFRYQVHNESITSRHQEKRKVVESELILFQEVLRLSNRNFTGAIPLRERRRLAFKYLLVAAYHRRLGYAASYLGMLLRELARF